MLYEGDNGYCAAVAEVDVNQDTGRVAVKGLVIANDVGPISNPDGLKNQLEGGALHGVSRALNEEVTWDDQKVTSIDWRTYHPLPVGADVPKIETVLINRPEARATGAGETAVTVVAAAHRKRGFRRNRSSFQTDSLHARTGEGRISEIESGVVVMLLALTVTTIVVAVVIVFSVIAYCLNRLNQS